MWRFAAIGWVIMAALPVSTRAQSQPAVDHHQHLFSPEIAKLAGLRTLTAADLVALLDLAGIQRAIVLSLGYQFGNPNRPVIADEYERVKAENDWTSQQVGCTSSSVE